MHSRTWCCQFCIFMPIFPINIWLGQQEGHPGYEKLLVETSARVCFTCGISDNQTSSEKISNSSCTFLFFARNQSRIRLYLQFCTTQIPQVKTTSISGLYLGLKTDVLMFASCNEVQHSLVRIQCCVSVVPKLHFSFYMELFVCISYCIQTCNS